MPLLDSLQQFDVALADFLTVFITACLLLLLLLTALCGPALAFVTESLYVARRKVFYDKCARQLAQVPFGLGLFLYVLLACAAALLLTRPDSPVTPAQARVALPLLCLPAAQILLVALWLFLWSPLKNQRAVHLFLGATAFVVSLSFLLFLVLTLTTLQQPFFLLAVLEMPLDALLLLLREFAATPGLWLFAAYLLMTGLCFTGALGQLWLIIRRAKVDYGRDYYAFAMRYAAGWSLVTGIIATALAGGLIWLLQSSVLPELGQPYEPGVLAVALGLPVACCILWGCILRSATPMRHKPGAFFACLFLFLALCAQILSFTNALPMP